MMYKAQGKEEVIHVHQKGFGARETPKSNWVSSGNVVNKVFMKFGQIGLKPKKMP